MAAERRGRTLRRKDLAREVEETFRGDRPYGVTQDCESGRKGGELSGSPAPAYPAEYHAVRLSFITNLPGGPLADRRGQELARMLADLGQFAHGFAQPGWQILVDQGPQEGMEFEVDEETPDSPN